MFAHLVVIVFFFFNDTATTEIYTLSLHDALPISHRSRSSAQNFVPRVRPFSVAGASHNFRQLAAGSRTPPVVVKLWRSEEHTSELQSRQYLVCRLLLEKKKTNRLQDRASA